ncbi:MAG: acetyl-CoA hydrolase, partial [Oscillospiraceae bacterium]
MGIERIRNEALRQRVTTAEDAAKLIHNGDIVGTSGFTAVGYPKAVPAALARRAEQGEDLGITVIVGGNAGEQLDGTLGRSGILRRRYGYQSNDFVRAQTNADKIKYIDMHVSHVPFYVKNGYLGHIDTAIFEIAGIDEKGNLIPSCAVGIMDVLAQCADKVILEINDTIPEEIAGMHDIYTPERFPNTRPIPILHPGDRVGVPYVKCDPDKIKAIVFTHEEDSNKDLMAPNEEMRAIADHLIAFLKD